ncbi:MAG: thiamine/thiamine pyrophosphate ABC transporter permease ThiP [Rhodobacteraceae bacterium]|nr:thiamine/thiamine pyrophosphate ABC transporter permease ThiP [Paracoccaceae bacterium]
MAGSAQPMKPAGWAGIAAAGLLAALSLGTLAVVAIRAESGAGFGPADLAAIRFTVTQALASAALSVLLGVPVARALARRRFAGRGLLITLLGAPFLLPVIVAVLGLLAVFGRAGLLSSALIWLGLPPLDIYGFRGVVLAHVFFNLPLATRLILQGWQAIPGEHFRLAAQLGMTSRDIARRLERPMLRAVLPGAFATIFLLCVTSFAVALTLGGGPGATTVELAIYQAFRFDFDLGKAASLAMVQFGLCAGAALVAWMVAVPAAFGGGLDRPVERWDCHGLASRLADTAALALVSVFLILPLTMVALSGLGGLADLPPGLWRAALRSVLVALASGALAITLALVLAGAVVRMEVGAARFAGLLEASGYLSVAASPMVIGTGLFLLLFPLADPAALALPVTALVNAAMSLPFALRALIPAMRDVERDYGRLAQSLGMTGAARFRLLTWPRIRPAAGFAAGLAAALSMGDLGVIALFADADAVTLPLLLYRLMGSYQMVAAHGTALVLVVLSLGLFWLFDRGGRFHAAA